MKLLCVLGRQPALSLAELESRLGADAITPLSEDITQIETDQTPDFFDTLGGVQKVGKIIATLDSTDWNKSIRQIEKHLKDLLLDTPDGKVTLGLSVHGLNADARQINAAALSLKKTIKNSGRSARIVPNAEPTLNTAQVIHNKLTEPNGIELLIVRCGNQLLIARTGWVQDIEAYRRRDQERPMRDARVGMLPPKLAQIIINLAVGQNDDDQIVLDPFCGTGVVLQEALLADNGAIGTDLEPRMVEYSEKNLAWLEDKAGQQYNATLKVGNATSMQWPNPFTVIACETYLGRALSSMPDQETLQKIINDCNQIHKKFLSNVARQTESGFRMCIAVPAWRTNRGFKHMAVLDHLEELGYNQVSFVHAKTTDLVYHREDQIVARELVVLTRK